MDELTRLRAERLRYENAQCVTCAKHLDTAALPAEDRAVTAPPQTWLVAVKRETDPWEVLTFDRYDQAAMFWDRAQTQWSDVYFCRVAYGPRDVCGDLERPSRAVTAPQEPEELDLEAIRDFGGVILTPAETDQVSAYYYAMVAEVERLRSERDEAQLAAARWREQLAAAKVKLAALTHAIEALREELATLKGTKQEL